MKTHLIISLCLLVLFPFTLNGQDSSYYYYFKGKRVYLDVDRNYANIVSQEKIAKTILSRLQNMNLNITEYEQSKSTIIKLKFTTLPGKQEYAQMIKELKKEQGIKNIFPFFSKNGSKPIGTSSHFYVKLKNLADTLLLSNIARQVNVEVIKQVPYMPEWYILSIGENSPLSNSLEASSYFYETKQFENVDPAFMFEFKPACTNEPYFGSQWGLKNNSNLGIDINVCDAWSISKGEGVKVAVVDQGIYMQHSDLAPNIYHKSLNAEDNTFPSIFEGYEHGTHVAGIIAAVENNSQIIGVAPQAKIMGISHHFHSSYLSDISPALASGISWAWKNGADIINNSWGDDTYYLLRYIRCPILEEAISEALIRGRNNKGCVIVFSAGNGIRNREDDGDSDETPVYVLGPVSYPATINDSIITVGALGANGKRSGFSNYRINSDEQVVFGIDVMAPGENILSTLPYNQTGYKNGTSMAAPHVAGIAALILSVNPQLTGQQVRNIIESTTKKVGNYNYIINTGRPNGTWNEEVGYGLVDAHKAVIRASRVEIRDRTLNTSQGTYAFPCTNKDVFIENITLKNGAALTAGSNMRTVILPPFKAEKGSMLLIEKGSWMNDVGFNCNDDASVYY